jgi:radical SAM protein (TIGR01212 family)
MQHYYSYSSYLKKRFGVPVAKIPINGGFSCPNRDGVKSRSGCAFCDNRAFSPVADSTLFPLDQLKAGIARSQGRFTSFIAYLQPFSNTYGSVERLRAVYEPLIAIPGIVGLSVGTRPDCLAEEAYEYLGELAGRTYLSVELGLQSAHDSTLSFVNRGHSFQEFSHAVERLSRIGIECVAHVMVGLPGENAAMIFETAHRLAGLPVTGVKIHQLMVIQGTRMEQMLAEGSVAPLEIADYAVLLSGFLERLRPDQHIHRIMADTRKEFGLIAPEWSAHKKDSMAFLSSYLESNRIVQGGEFRCT